MKPSPGLPCAIAVAAIGYVGGTFDVERKDFWTVVVAASTIDRRLVANRAARPSSPSMTNVMRRKTRSQLRALVVEELAAVRGGADDPPPVRQQLLTGMVLMG